MVQTDAEGRAYLSLKVQLTSGRTIKTRYYREINTDSQWIFLISEEGRLLQAERRLFPRMIQDIARAWLAEPKLIGTPQTTHESLFGLLHEVEQAELDDLRKGHFTFQDSVHDLISLATTALSTGAVYFTDEINEENGVFTYRITFSPKEEAPDE